MIGASPQSVADDPLPLTLAGRLASERCALLVIDMQNDFCAPGGYLHAVMGKDVSGAASLVGPLSDLIEAARGRQVPVVWVHADYSPGKIPASMRVKLRAAGITAICCEPGTWGADAFGVTPLDHEARVMKHSYSGFAGTSLADLLAEIDVRTLVFAGVQTQVCVESTVRDAHSLGFFCVVPQDAVGSHTPALHRATLDNIRFLFGDVCDVADVKSAWNL